MWKKASPYHVRRNNQLAVLSTIYEKGTTSRSDLARILNLSKPSISDNLMSLIEMGIIIEEKGANRSGGCKPRLISFNSIFRYIIALDLHYNDPIFALGNLGGEIIDKFSIKVAEGTPFPTRASMLVNGIRLLLHAKNIEPGRLASIAVSAPGIYQNDMILSYANKQHLVWNMPDLINVLQDTFGVHVFCQNDAKAAAVGELQKGEGMGTSNLVYLRCGLGVGVGIILNRVLFEGIGNAAGEIYCTTDMQKREKGLCLEDVVSILGLVERIRADEHRAESPVLSGLPPEEIDFPRIVAAYQQGDEYILKHVRRIGAELGCVVANITSLLTIETIVIGGEYDVFQDVLVEEIRAVTDRYCFNPPVVRASRLGRYAGINGLLALARQNFFKYIVERNDE